MKAPRILVSPPGSVQEQRGDAAGLGDGIHLQECRVQEEGKPLGLGNGEHPQPQPAELQPPGSQEPHPAPSSWEQAGGRVLGLSLPPDTRFALQKGRGRSFTPTFLSSFPTSEPKRRQPPPLGASPRLRNRRGTNKARGTGRRNTIPPFFSSLFSPLLPPPHPKRQNDKPRTT